MRRVIGGVLVALALAGCAGGSGEASEGAPRAAQTGTTPSVENTALDHGVTRSPSPGAATVKPDKSSAPRETSTVKPVKVTLLRSGGVAGVRDELVVATSGKWTYTTHRDTESGRLSSRLTTKLHRLANDPRLAAEARKSKPGFGEQCPDSFQYRLTAGEVTVHQSGCGEQPERPVYQEIVQLLSEHTAF